MIHVVIWGAGGRMGKRLIKQIQQAPDMTLAGAIEADGHPGVFQDAGHYHHLPQTGVLLTKECDAPPDVSPGIVLDFSLSGGVEKACDWATKNRWAVISGSTDLSDNGRIALKAASETVPVMYAPNFSIGITLLLKLVAQAAAALPESFDAMIIETHHSEKKDRPSGTARAFEQRLKDHGPKRRIETVGLRGGMIFGEHTIRLVSPMEDITITHRALDRDVFASGTLEATRWLVRRQPGLYSFSDMLELA
ncbi:4-hydroxy-tetrahydrodipicolinate reductase [bacterium]|nr:4-hydroxy-tetrahydrodipicolinate reductase [candidate division CSSED10-310 bacterium]